MDAISCGDTTTFTEHEVFDYYPELFLLNKNDYISEESPLIDFTYHRMLYRKYNSLDDKLT